ncbi:hypothetical protein L1887_56020 [Cichorium endivia]|nr:hypothetical protein L1887_56020 [Cichorium endivia]
MQRSRTAARLKKLSIMVSNCREAVRGASSEATEPHDGGIACVVHGEKVRNATSSASRSPCYRIRLASLRVSCNEVAAQYLKMMYSAWMIPGRTENLRAAATLEEDTKRREEDGQDDLDNVAASERHDGRAASGRTGS